MLGTHTEEISIMTAGFLDATHVVTGGAAGRMSYSIDGAKTWLETNSASDCRYGIEIVNPQVIWTCGGATDVRKSVDGGRTWQVVAAFGNPRTITNPCHSMSFLDDKTGWLANSNLFGTTNNGGTSWTMRELPQGANQVATIDTYAPGQGYLLDQDGRLFFSEDDGVHWRAVGTLWMGPFKMSASVYQLAAMRFTDLEHGLIVISPDDYGTNDPLIAFHTTDGGQTWTSELVPAPAGPVYLSRTGNFLTVNTSVNQLTLLQYGE